MLFGILNVYSVELGKENFRIHNFFSSYAAKQLVCLGLSILVCFLIANTNYNFIQFLIPAAYFCNIALLLFTKFSGKSIYGHNSWLKIGPFNLQPAEFAKMTTALFIAQIFNYKDIKLNVYKIIKSSFCILLPTLIIASQGDIGSCLVFSSFSIVFLRENYLVKLILFASYVIFSIVLSLFCSKIYISIGIISLVIIMSIRYLNQPMKILYSNIFGILTYVICHGTNFFVYNFLKPHQRDRVISWIDPERDILGIGWNATQSKIAIGSGGLFGKGFLQGTQTKYGFVPEQHTDFIFCTIGEEYGFWGSILFILAFCILIGLIFMVSEKSSYRFTRIYGYGVASILFFHFIINVGMTIGLFPIIGIPLPFVSYGGSALMSFVIMVFLFLKFNYSDKVYMRK